MRIRRSSTQASKAGAAGAAKKAKGASGPGFAQMVSRVSSPEAAEAMVRDVRSALLEELLGVAQELADGKQNQEETTKRFVSAVVKDRFKGLKGKDAKQVGESVSDLINRDEALAQRLHNQLLRLAKS